MPLLYRTLVAMFVCFLGLFCTRAAYEYRAAQYNVRSTSRYNSADFSYSKKNYASEKALSASNLREKEFHIQPSQFAPKYEKIASLGQVTQNYDNDYKKIEHEIKNNQGVVQYESAAGLKGKRQLNLGIGIPPDQFDQFVDNVKQIGEITSFNVIKNDKTSEYQRLGAERKTLEQARNAIAELRKLNATVDERLNLEARYNEIEQKIQDLGVSLGDFDSGNELYTVKISLKEFRVFTQRSLSGIIKSSLRWSAKLYFLGALGLFLMAAFSFLGILLMKIFINIISLTWKKI